ncbi:MAG: response regulator, partial [Terriglobales bacterium]
MATSGPARLLVVDDEPMVRELLCSYLGENGFECLGSGGVEDALRCLASGRIDLIISDLHMPGRTGLELLEAVGVSYPETAFLMATAAPDTRVAIEAMRNGAADFLLKPLDLKHVLATVREALERQRARLAVERRRREVERLLAERTEQLSFALRQLQQASAETLQALAMAVDVRAHDVAGHS